MAFTTPSFNYGTRANDLTTQKGLSDIAGDYGRFLGQQRRRRLRDDNNRLFEERFPQIGSSFNRRNLYHSGLRRGAQRREVNELNRAQSRIAEDEATEAAGFQQQRAFSDAAYQRALLALMEDMQRQRAAGYDPFAQLGF